MDDKKLYKEILGIVAPWKIEKVALDIDNDRVDIFLGWPYLQDGICPVCCRFPRKFLEKLRIVPYYFMQAKNNEGE